MYAHHFGLTQDPFSIAPDPRYLFMSERHREALAHLLFGVGDARAGSRGTGGGFVLLTGDIGTGKTTICRCFLEQIPAGCHVAYIFNPKLSVTELLQSICEEFHITLAQAAVRSPTVKDYVDALNAFLLRSHAAGESCLLIIDEAQNLAPDVLEQLRLLTNLETNERKLLQIVLIGQPELRTMLARPELEQLAQRVIARFHLDALSASESTQYIEHRLAVAGHSGALPFDRQALQRTAHCLSAGRTGVVGHGRAERFFAVAPTAENFAVTSGRGASRASSRNSADSGGAAGVASTRSNRDPVAAIAT
jgi:general secretion pathway protein A